MIIFKVIRNLLHRFIVCALMTLLGPRFVAGTCRFLIPHQVIIVIRILMGLIITRLYCI